MPSRPSSPRLRPCIAELLRTCVHPHSLLLRLEKIAIQSVPHSGAETADRDEPCGSENEGQIQNKFCCLWLSDGELMVQAVLEQSLHQIFLTEDPAVGSLLDIKKFRVRRGRRVHTPGEVLYLAIADYETILSAHPATSTRLDDFTNEGGFIREGTQTPKQKRRLGSHSAGSLRSPASPAAMPTAPSSQDSDSFETAQVEPEILDRRRQALYELSSNTQPLVSEDALQDRPPRKRRRVLERKATGAITSPARHDRAIGLADEDRGKDSNTTPSSSDLPHAEHDHSLAAQQPSRPAEPISGLSTTRATIPTSTPAIPPLHTLSSLLHPPINSPLPSRNYVCSVFAIVSWCSPSLIFPRHAQSPFPPKRHIKIHDPSIAARYAGITVAVYDDARTFKPKIGTVALFCGVVMQRWEGEVILNAYARRVERDRDIEEGEHDGRGWYVDDEESLVGMGYDVKGLADWWAERSHSRGQKVKKDSSAT